MSSGDNMNTDSKATASASGGGAASTAKKPEAAVNNSVTLEMLEEVSLGGGLGS